MYKMRGGRFLASLLLSLAPLCAADLRVGAAEVVITPPKGAPMAGYYFNRAADGVHDDLHAKAIVIQIDGDRAALVACDLESLPRDVVELARAEIQQTTGIPASHVMISATHTHTGPVLLTGGTDYNVEGEMKRIGTEYTAALPSKIADSVRNAVAQLKPAAVRVASGREDSLTFNRRFHMKDGTVGWNPGKLNPNILRPAGPIDGSVPVVYFEAADRKPVAAYVNYALHLDTVGGTEYSADYPYTLSRLLADARGSGLITMFTIGCAGNLNHIDVNSADPQKGNGEAARIGTILGAEVLKSLRHGQSVVPEGIRTSSEIVRLPLPTVAGNDVDWARTTAATFGKPGAAPFLDLVRAEKIVEVAGRKGVPLDAEVQVIALGDQIAVVGLPGEIFTELGLAIKEASPFPQTIVAELANGSVGYVPDKKAYAQGAYEVVSARCAAGSGEMLVESATRQLIALFDAARGHTTQ